MKTRPNVIKIGDGLYRLDLRGKSVLSNSAFIQPLGELGVILKSDEIAASKKRTYTGVTKSIKDTPLAMEIVNVVKVKGKTDVEGLVTALEGKAAKNTISNYASRLVSEGVLHRPERGVFAVRS